MQSLLGTTLGALFLGGLGTAMLYGCTNIQLCLYFSNYQRDPLMIKLTVAVLWILDSFHMVLTLVVLWHYLIASYGDYLELLMTPWPVRLQNSVNVAVVLVVQSLYTIRIRTLSSHLDHKFWPRILIIVLLAGYVSGTILIFEMSRTTLYAQAEGYRWAIYFSLSMSTFNDFMIAAAICHLLSSRGTTLVEMKSKVWIIMRYAVISGTLTSICSLSALITFHIMPSNLVYMAQVFLISKLYINSYLAMLNARNSLRGCRSVDLSRLEVRIVESQHVVPMNEMEVKRTINEDSRSISSEEAVDPPSRSCNLNRI